MTVCPSDEQLTGLLAEALSPAQREALARHVEGCPSCQEELARLPSTPDTDRWRLAEHPPQGSRAEDEMIRRLKRTPVWLVPTAPVQAPGPGDPSPYAGIRSPAAAGW